MSQAKIATKKQSRVLWPVMGFFLALACGVIAYVAAPSVIDFTKTALPGFRTAGIAPDTLRLLFTGIIFVILITISGILIALFAPKRSMNITDQSLAKERAGTLAKRKNEKVMQQRVNSQMRDDLRKRSGK